MSNGPPPSASKISSRDINLFTEEEYAELLHPSNKLLLLDGRGQRFDLHPGYRIPLVMMISGVIGGLNGMTNGARLASLKYLASNSHRLPKTQNGWYFYHKRKNYVCLQKAISSGVMTGLKVSGFIGSVFTLELSLDYLRGCIDFANTAMSFGVLGWCYAVYHDFTHVQTKSLIRRGFGVGVMIGLIQDGLQLLKGDDVWYMRQFFGIYPRDVSDRKLQKFNI